MLRLARFARLGRSYGTIGEAGGAFARKGSAQEEKFIHDHEVEVIEQYKLKLKLKEEEHRKEVAAHEAAMKAEKPAQKHFDPIPTPVSASHSGFGYYYLTSKKEAAVEEQYFRKQDNEKISKLKEEISHLKQQISKK